MVERRNWTLDELRLALYLYFQLPFGKLHSRQPDVVKLAARINRTSSAVAMKLVNFASLDPKIVDTGRLGLGNSSALDREAWDRFTSDWAANVAQAADALEDDDEAGAYPPPSVNELSEPFEHFSSDAPTTQLGTVALRIGQSFFRKAVLANFEGACCITGIADSRLLVASHIRPWSVDTPNRLNPANGLCLSGTLDRAFDAGLITVSTDYACSVSPQLLNHTDSKTRKFFEPLDGKSLSKTRKITLLEDALQWHRMNLFNLTSLPDEYAADLLVP